MNQEKLAYWLKSAELDKSSIRRTITAIRMIRGGHFSPENLKVEMDALCFWWEQRRVSRAEIRRLKGGAL